MEHIVKRQSYASNDNSLRFIFLLKLLSGLPRPIEILYIVDGYIAAFRSEFLSHESTQSSVQTPNP